MSEQSELDNARKRALYEQCGFQYGPRDASGAQWGYGYAPYKATDEIYYGAKAVVDMEWYGALQWRHPTKEGDEQAEREARSNLVGLALSGGGIRSASFSLGVMQALAKAGWLKRIDYLSTVSGGGYIGSSLTWLLHKTWDAPGTSATPPKQDATQEKTGGEPAPAAGEAKATLSYGMDWEHFPYRTYPIAESMPLPNDVYSGRILRYLRQHARYLTPGGGLDWVSLAAVVLRNTLYSLIVYGSILVVVYVLLHGLSLLTGSSIIPDPCSEPSLQSCFPQGDTAWPGTALFRYAGYVLGIWAVLAVAYIVLALCFERGWCISTGQNTNYTWRRLYEKRLGRWPLIVALLLAIVGSAPAAYHWLGTQGSVPAVQEFTIKGAPSKAGEWTIEGTIKPPALVGAAAASETGLLKTVFDNLQWLAGLVSSLAGVAMSLFAFKKTSSVKAGRIPIGVVAVAGSIALIFGFLMLAYHVYYWVGREPHWLALGLIVILLLARFANINHLSLHRYYRDRLMETFLPNIKDALDVQGTVTRGTTLQDSDSTRLYEMCPTDPVPPKEGEADQATRQMRGPFHIINANIVLVSSHIPKFRGRGGDNFILTPQSCGSNATGWCETGREESDAQAGNSPFENLTFASAMAISGAAVNPNTGSGGQGITRQPLLSFLMGILNIRLGYWAPNPGPPSECLDRLESIEERRASWGWWRAVRLGVYRLISSPWIGNENALSPGIGELFLRRYLDENSHNIQLSDGGHFENLGLYELVRRRLKVIIVCDGAEDLDFTFCDLANAIKKVRADFGAKIEIDSTDLDALIPKREKKPGETQVDEAALAFSRRGYLIAPIRYTKLEGENKARVGTLVYLTTAFLKSHSAELYAYKKVHPEFPDQPTSDQFFDETQFEAYRELGFQVAHRMLCDAKNGKIEEAEAVFGTPDISCPPKWDPPTNAPRPET